MKILLVAGMILFLIGLLNGLLIPILEDLHMGQTAHLVGIQNAVVLILFGLTLKHVSLPSNSISVLTVLSIYGMYSIWFAVVLTATSVTNAENSISALKENIAPIFLYSGSLAIIIATILVIIGLIREKFS